MWKVSLIIAAKEELQSETALTRLQMHANVALSVCYTNNKNFIR